MKPEDFESLFKRYAWLLSQNAINVFVSADGFVDMDSAGLGSFANSWDMISGQPETDL